LIALQTNAFKLQLEKHKTFGFLVIKRTLATSKHPNGMLEKATSQEDAAQLTKQQQQQVTLSKQQFV